MESFSWHVILQHFWLAFIFVWYYSHKIIQIVKLSLLSYKGQLTCHIYFWNQKLTSHIFFWSNQNQNWNCSHDTIVRFFTDVVYIPQTQNKTTNKIDLHQNENKYQEKVRGEHRNTRILLISFQLWRRPNCCGKLLVFSQPC